MPETETFIFDSTSPSEPPALSTPVSGLDDYCDFSLSDSFLVDTSNLPGFHRHEPSTTSLLSTRPVAPTSSITSSNTCAVPSTTATTHSPAVESPAIQTDEQGQGMAALEKEFGLERIQKHKWNWVEYPSKRPSEWIPEYKYANGLDINGIYQEYITGIDGHLSTKQLDAKWGSSWRAGQRGLSSESCRRKKLITVIEKLGERKNWNVQLALRYLTSRYPIKSGPGSLKHLRTTRAFMSWLQQDDGETVREVLTGADTYC